MAKSLSPQSDTYGSTPSGCTIRGPPPPPPLPLPEQRLFEPARYPSDTESTYAESVYSQQSVKDSRAQPPPRTFGPVGYFNDVADTTYDESAYEESIYEESIYAESVCTLPPARQLNDIPELGYFESVSEAPSAVYSPPPPPPPPTGFSSSYLNDAPESVYAESVCSLAAPSYQSTLLPYYPSPAHYYLQPATTSREPMILYNKNCGAKYKSVGAIRKAELSLFDNLWSSQQMQLMQILCNIYHYRNNTIPAKGKLKREVICSIFQCDITDYNFALVEVYKRYCMRIGLLYGRSSVGDYNFWALPAKELDRFRDWLQRVGSWTDKYETKHVLWTFGKDDEGKSYLKLKLNEFTLNYIQLLNSIYDSLAAWRDLDGGEDYIKYERRLSCCICLYTCIFFFLCFKYFV